MGNEIIRQYGMPDRRGIEPVGSFGKDLVTASAGFVCGSLVSARGGRAAALIASEICNKGAGVIYDFAAPRFRKYTQGFTPVPRQVLFVPGPQVPLPPPPRQQPPPPVSQPPAPPPRQPPTPPPPGQPPNVPPNDQPPYTEPPQAPVYPTPPPSIYGKYDKDQGSAFADAFEGLYRAFVFATTGNPGGPGFVEGEGGTGGTGSYGSPGLSGLAGVVNLPHEIDPVWLVRKFGSELQNLFGLGQTKIDKQKENIQDLYTAIFRFFASTVPNFKVNDDHALQFKSKGVLRELSERPEIGALYSEFLPDAHILATSGIGYDKSGPGVEERLVNQFLANAANSGWTVDQTRAVWKTSVEGAKATQKGV